MLFRYFLYLTRRAVFHIEKAEGQKVTGSVTREAEREERPGLTFNLVGRDLNLTSVKIVAIILISLALVYAVLRVVRGRIVKKVKGK